MIVVIVAACMLFALVASFAFFLWQGQPKPARRKKPKVPDPGPIDGGGEITGNGGEGALIDTLQADVIDVSIKPGQGAGKAHALNKRFRSSGLPDAVIVVFPINFGSGFEWGCRGKIGGIKIGPGAASGCNYSSNGASNRLMWDAGGGAYSYVYIPQGSENQQPSQLSNPPRCGQSVWKEEFAGVFKPGTWHTVRLGVKLNTPGKGDGKLLFGVDGTVKTLSGVVWRTQSGIKIEGFDLGIFHGGPCSATQNSSLQIKNIKVHKWDA